MAEKGQSGGRAPTQMTKLPSTSLLHGFTVSARELGKVFVQGKDEENAAQLERLGGVRGLGMKLSTNLVTGINGDEEDLQHRQEA